MVKIVVVFCCPSLENTIFFVFSIFVDKKKQQNVICNVDNKIQAELNIAIHFSHMHLQ